jgi:hypothetical protein
MKAVFSLLGLVFVVAIIGLVAKKQLTAAAPVSAPVNAGAPGAPAISGTPQQQVQQMRQAAEAAVQQPRAMPDDSK